MNEYKHSQHEDISDYIKNSKLSEMNLFFFIILKYMTRR